MHRKRDLHTRNYKLAFCPESTDPWPLLAMAGFDFQNNSANVETLHDTQKTQTLGGALQTSPGSKLHKQEITCLFSAMRVTAQRHWRLWKQMFRGWKFLGQLEKSCWMTPPPYVGFISWNWARVGPTGYTNSKLKKAPKQPKMKGKKKTHISYLLNICLLFLDNTWFLTTSYGASSNHSPPQKSKWAKRGRVWGEVQMAKNGNLQKGRGAQMETARCTTS